MKEVINWINPDIVLIQETKLGDVDRFLVRSIWDCRFKDWDFLPSVGSGGLLGVWDTRVVSKVDSLVGTFSLSILLDFKGKGYWWVTNVYGPTNSRLWGFLWDELSYVYGFCSPHWCVRGILMLSGFLVRSQEGLISMLV